MNIVIPLAGKGTRFPKNEYPLPKPLIKIQGKPMIQHAIESLGLSGRFYFIINDDEHSMELTNLLTILKPGSEILPINYTTKGPASSCILFKSYINNSEELVIANCDQIMWWDSDLFLAAARIDKYDGVVVTYSESTPHNSYAKIDNRGRVELIKEKEVISNISLNGIHYWRKGADFVFSYEQMVRNKDTAPNGEYYVGPTYNYLIQMGRTIGIHHIPNQQHNPVGKPDDLQAFLSKTC